MSGLTLSPTTNFPINFKPIVKPPLLHLKSSISCTLHSNDIAALRSASVRLIDGNQNMVGLVSKAQARQMAQDAQLDLVIVSPDSDPPVVRMMDYNKYKYELQKKKKGQQKRSSANRMDLKELKMGSIRKKQGFDEKSDNKGMRLTTSKWYTLYGDNLARESVLTQESDWKVARKGDSHQEL